MEKCKYKGRCGGCTHIGMSYEEQLAIKQQEMEKLLGKYGKVLPIVGAANPYNYRNKVHAVLGMGKNGQILSGTYEAGTHRVVDVENCMLDNKKADEIIRTVAKLMKSFKYAPYDEDRHRGFLRHVLVRTAHKTGQIMVILVVADKIFPSKNNFVKALLKEYPEITTIVMNFNNKNTSMVLGDFCQTLYGKGYIDDELCGCRFVLSPKSFYQINSEQTEVLYNKAIEYAAFSGREKIIDAYSGIGTIGIIASGRVRQVVGVELNPDAVRDAGINIKNNKCKNVTYIRGDASEFMRKEAAAKHRYDVVITDPPRSGCDKVFMDSMAMLLPKRLVYVSCNPETLARDATYLKKKGYNMKECVPVDMFPWTDKTECVSLFEHR